MRYPSALYCANLHAYPTVSNATTKSVFFKINSPSRFFPTLLTLFPHPRDKYLMSKLRLPRKFPAQACRTEKFQSLIKFGLLWYQYFFFVSCVSNGRLNFCVHVFCVLWNPCAHPLSTSKFFLLKLKPALFSSMSKSHRCILAIFWMLRGNIIRTVPC